VSGKSEQFGVKELNKQTIWMTVVVFVMHLLIIVKGYRQLQSANDWYKPESMFDHISDRAIQVEDTIKHALKQVWLNPVRAFWYSLLYILGERMEDFWTVCDVMTYWLVNATLLFLIWRTTITVEFAVMTTFLILFKFLGYLRGFDNCGWLLRVLNQMSLDSKGFLVAILTIFLGFAVMFHILLGPYNENYTTAAKSFVSIFEIGILGYIDRTDFGESQSNCAHNYAIGCSCLGCVYHCTEWIYCATR
jgi:hypothetical protein